jgi:glutaredoxin
MANVPLVEVISAGCALCDSAVERVTRLVGDPSRVTVLDMHEPAVARRVEQLGVRTVPAVVIDGKLAPCCAGGGVDEAVVRAGIVGSGG